MAHSDRGESRKLREHLIALQPLLEAYEQRLRATRGLRSVERGELVRQVVAKLLARPELLPRDDGELGMRRYVLRMLANEATDTGRREGRDSARQAHAFEFDEYAGPLATTGAVTRADQLEALERLIRALPDKYRPIMELALRDGLDFEAIGLALDLDRRAVRRRYERARELLQRRLDGARDA